MGRLQKKPTSPFDCFIEELLWLNESLGLDILNCLPFVNSRSTIHGVLAMMISYLMAARDEAKYLALALTSLAAQDHDQFEVIIVDDNSTDHTLDLALFFAGKYSWISVFCNPGCGKVSAYNKAFSHASGELLAFMAGDDELPRKSSSYRVQQYDQFLVDSGDDLRPWLLRGRLETISYDRRRTNRVIPKLSSKGNPSGGTCTFNRSFAKELFPIPCALPSEDSWLKPCSRWCDAFVQDTSQVLYYYRLHDRNLARRSNDFQKFNKYLSAREDAVEIFLKQKQNQLSLRSKVEINHLIEAYRLRQNQKTLKLLFTKKIKLRERLRLIMYSSPTLYRTILWLNWIP